ncbi:MAG: L,D-transpeptidase family protein [Archangium sp.]|nr:L,D-transpeptidase family protein [Archangium sp.]
MRLLLLLLPLVATTALAKDKVKEVRTRRAADVKALVERAGLSYPVDEVYLRAFKKERQLELWAGKKGQPMALVKTYPFCAASGELGPKRKEGDSQVPEGLYEVPSFNPYSSYHLSMEVSYPNASDRLRSDARRPGGNIYLHGSCASIGCIAIEDEPIEEVYLITVDAKRRPIRVDIFPARLDPAGLKSLDDPAQADFWNELAPAYAAFEQNHRPAAFTVSKKTGAYLLK